MKVEIDVVKRFVPVTIRLETKEELDLMWHILNRGSRIDTYCDLNGVDEYRFREFKTTVWNDINGIRKECK
jgi:hypothetical protein